MQIIHKLLKQEPTPFIIIHYVYSLNRGGEAADCVARLIRNLIHSISNLLLFHHCDIAILIVRYRGLLRELDNALLNRRTDVRSNSEPE